MNINLLSHSNRVKYPEVSDAMKRDSYDEYVLTIVYILALMSGDNSNPIKQLPPPIDTRQYVKALILLIDRG